MKSYVLTFLFFLLFFKLNAQSFNLKNYNSESGLPWYNISDVFQDKKGYVWIATDMGVSRFDGYEFHNYELKDGLVDNAIVDMYEDNRGVIWFLSAKGRLAYFENDEVKAFTYNNRIESYMKNKKVSAKGQFLVDEGGDILIGIANQPAIKINQLGIIRNDIVYEEKQNVILELIGQKVFIHWPEVLVRDAAVKVKIRNQYSRLMLKAEDLLSSTPVSVVSDKYLYYASTNTLFQINLRNGLVKTRNFANRILSVNVKDVDEIWIGFQFEGIKIIQNDLQEKTKLNLLKGNSISKVFWDHEGGTWIATKENGLFYTLLTEVVTLNKADGLISTKIRRVIANKRGDLIVAYTKEIVDVFDQNGNLLKRICLAKDELVTSVFYDRNTDRMYIASENNLYRMLGEKLVRILNISCCKINNVYALDNELFLSTTNGFFIYRNDVLAYSSSKEGDFNLHVNSLVKHKDGSLWIGTNEGLWKFYNGVYAFYGIINPAFKYPITGLELTDQNYLVAGTNGNGLLIYLENQLYSVTSTEGLSSNEVTSVDCKDHQIWVGTNKGLNLVTDEGVFETVFKVKNYTTNDGLVSNFINDLFLGDKNVYLATNSGVNVFNPENLKENKIPPKLYFTSIQINNKDTVYQENFTLKYSQNNLNIQYLGLSFQNPGDILYKYKLNQLDSVWYYTRSRNIRYSSLPPGKFTFQVNARNSDGYWSIDPAQFSFEVKRPFWRTNLFVGSVSLFILIFGVLIILLLRRSYRRQFNLMNYRQQVLRQQMNPHFIFNTLNSIQLFILEKNTLLSQKYLGAFSRLMRLNLENYQFEAVTVRSEVESLRLYLELEMLRLDDQISFDLIVENEEEVLNMNIPSLIIQPFVENSIWHGLMHKNGHGHIDITLRPKKDYILCIVEDDGIGRKMADEIKKQKMEIHKSYGISITSKRIELLNNLYKRDLSIKYFDLKDENNQSTGTRVEIKIPVFTKIKKMNW